MTYEIRYFAGDNKSNDLFYSSMSDERVGEQVRVIEGWMESSVYAYHTVSGIRLLHNGEVVFEIHKDKDTNRYKQGVQVTTTKSSLPSIRPKSIIEI